MRRVGLRELKARLSDYVARAHGGEIVIVTHRNKPVAQLVPLDDSSTAVQQLLRLAGQGTVVWSGGKPAGLGSDKVPIPPGRTTLSDLVVEERAER